MLIEDDVDAAVENARGPGRGLGDLPQFGRKHGGQTFAPTGAIGHPVVGDALHGGHGPMVDDEDPPVPAIAVVLVDEPLQVINAVDHVRVQFAIAGVDQFQPPAAVAEQGFLHQPMPVAEFRGDDLRGGLPGLADPDRRRRHPVFAQQEAGHAFIDSALYAPRIVIDENAQLAQGVENVQPEGDLLETARGHGAHKGRVRQGGGETGDVNARRMLFKPEAALGQGDDLRGHAAPLQRRRQSLFMPAVVFGEDDLVSHGCRLGRGLAPRLFEPASIMRNPHER